MHVANLMANCMDYVRYCSIIQSSGTGKLRLLDELSKGYPPIPVNLHEEGTSGASHLFFIFFVICHTRHLDFPPPGIVIRDFLTPFDNEYDQMETKSYSRACHFLRSLFMHTKNLIVDLSDNKADRITQFMQFMSKGQTFQVRGAEDDWKNFYRVVVRRG
jgi:hypothetical protein